MNLDTASVQCPHASRNLETADRLLEGGVSDGVRTRDLRSHSPALYQLSYAHHCQLSVNSICRLLPSENVNVQSCCKKTRGPTHRRGLVCLPLRGACGVQSSYRRLLNRQFLIELPDPSNHWPPFWGTMIWHAWQDSNLLPSA